MCHLLSTFSYKIMLLFYLSHWKKQLTPKHEISCKFQLLFNLNIIPSGYVVITLTCRNDEDVEREMESEPVNTESCSSVSSIVDRGLGIVTVNTEILVIVICGVVSFCIHFSIHSRNISNGASGPGLKEFSDFITIDRRVVWKPIMRFVHMIICFLIQPNSTVCMSRWKRSVCHKFWEHSF